MMGRLSFHDVVYVLVVLVLCSFAHAFVLVPLAPANSGSVRQQQQRTAATSGGGFTPVVATSPRRPSSSRLFAKKKASRKKAVASTGGFGGAAMESCACGSGLAYNKCCGRLHKDPASYAAAPASQVVRARYSAYSKRLIDFIIASTHPLNPSFEQDMEHWRTTMEQDCFDNFELTKCEILDESYEGEGADEIATVRFMAHMTQRDSQAKSAFVETSTFERDGLSSGAWLYLDGVVVPVDLTTGEAVEQLEP